MKIRLGKGCADMMSVAEWCNGELYDFTAEAGCSFEYVCTDSREADENTMFVATRGERVDGHDYISKALDNGCRCVLCEYVPSGIAGRCAAFVVVQNSIDAFADTARGYRADNALDTVAVTGSVGKTTTKELCAAIIKQFKNLYYTEGNFNSIIGMPMSLMEVGEACDAAVFEMGMSAFGEIRSMTLTARPRVAMVTNVGSSHLEYLKTRENIAKAKLEIAEGLSDGGYLLLNGDEPLLYEVKPLTDAEINTVYVTLEDRADCGVRASNIRVGESETLFDLYCLGVEYKDLKINLVGRAFVYNASFAACAGQLLGASEQDIRDGLASYVASGMRQSIEKKDGVTVIMDCYNAAPESMRSAIDMLMAQKVSGRRIAVLGDMRELGEGAVDMHVGVGKYAALAGVDMIFTLGELGENIARGARECGMTDDNIFSVLDIESPKALADALADQIKKGDAVLFKASRSVGMERVAHAVFDK